MQPNPSSKQSDSGRSPYRLLLSVGLPFVLVLAFLGKQFFNFDSVGWSNGFNHPLMGWDHLVTMLAVGIWAAQLRGQAIWMLPLAFVGVMSLGGLAGAAGLAIPSVEGIILLSCAVFSVLITRKVRFSAQVNVLIVAFFAFFHGFAHGQEISTSASLISYTLGFMLATLLLHGAGILVAKLVVFAVTCLLTVVFSSVALAKNAEAIIELEDNNTVVTQDQGLDSKTAFGIAIDQAGFGSDYFAIAAKRPVDHGFSRQGVGDGGGSAATVSLERNRVDSMKASAKSYSKGLDAVGKGDGLSLKQTALQVLDTWPFNADHSTAHRLGFKHYYPDINQTPGKRLLSNGVGLTSPPLSTIVPAPQASLKFRQTSVPSIEESNLQAHIARLDTGKATRKTIKLSCHDYAFRNPGHAAAHGKQHLTLIDTDSLVVSAISSLHLHTANPKNLPQTFSANRPPRLIPSQHNNKNQRDITA